MNKKVYIGICLDKSGSMGPIWKPTIEGLNKQIGSILEAARIDGIETTVSFYAFDREVHKVQQNQSINYLTEVALEDFSPKGETAFCSCLDAMIDDLSAVSDEASPDTSYLIYTFSDGEETVNPAGKKAVGGRIKEKESSGKWTFSFVGCDQDLEAVHRDYGFQKGNMVNFSKSSEGTKCAFAAASDSVGKYYRAAAGGQHTNSTKLYSDADEITDLTTPENLKTFKK